MFSGFAPAIGVFGTNTLKMAGNVMHNTVGSAMVVWGDKNEIINNLIVTNLWASVFNGRKEVNNKMEGAVEIGEHNRRYRENDISILRWLLLPLTMALFVTLLFLDYYSYFRF